MSKEVLDATYKGIWMASSAGSSGVAGVTAHMVKEAFPAPAVERIFAGINERAVLAMLARTRKDGLKISDRVWRTSERARHSVQHIVEDAVVRGQDARTTAKQVQKYLQPGVWTVHKEELRRRLRVHTDVSYEAMRLARTEMNNAFHEGMVAANQHSPGYQGIYWRLSAQHPVPDVCDDMAADMSNGEAGFYPKGQEPVRPHPQCFCNTFPAYERPERFTERLREWVHNPQLQPDIEKWYNEDARRFMGRPALLVLPQETPLAKVLREKEAKIAGLAHERVYVFDRNGNEVLGKKGTKTSVSFTPDEVKLMAGRDVILTHNHPSYGGSFSWPDANFAIGNNLAEMRAVGQEYVHSLTRPVSGWPSVETVKIEYDLANQEILRRIHVKLQQGQITIDEANRGHYHEVWMLIAGKLDLNYVRKRRVQ
ncbi:MAG: hypothetical protein DDT21_02757 [Syntrophomonadaceae bacterium]|nr:hypothetical protein [Bacillota bacterium]